MGCSGKIEIYNPGGHSRHRKRIENLIIGLFGAICIIMLVPIEVSAQVPRYSVDSVELYVYRDGLVHVAQILTINETFPDIKIKLMTPEIENTIVVNEDEAVLDYRIDGTSMIIFTLGTKRALVEYDTVVMTQLEAGMWTLILNSPHNLTTYFPEGATIIYLDKVPNLIDVEENRTILHLSPGTWEISYLLSVTPTPTPAAELIPAPPPFFGLEYLIIIIVVLIGVYILKRRKKLRLQDIFERHPNLNSDERDVIYHIYQKGGRVWESEVRRIFDLPKTSVWRLARRLEGMGIITVKKVGLQNRLELKGDFH